MSQVNTKISLVLFIILANRVISPGKNTRPFMFHFTLNKELINTTQTEEVTEPMRKYVEDVLINATRIFNMYAQVKVKCSGEEVSVVSRPDMNISVNIEKGGYFIAAMRKKEESQTPNQDLNKKLRLNKEELEKSMKLGNFYKMKYSLLMVHELIHAFEFVEENFANSLKPSLVNSCEAISPDQKEFLIALFELLNFNTDFDQSHWGVHKLPNDIMISYDMNKNLISSYTIFLLQHLNPMLDFNMDIDNFLYDPNFPDLETAKKLWKYKCEDDKESEVHAFCSYKDTLMEHSGCNHDFTSKTYCHTERLPNNCYARYERTETNCMNSNNNKESSLEVYGENSRCFKGFIASEKRRDKRSACIEINEDTFKKDSEKEIIKVTFEGKTLDCKAEHYIVENRDENSKIDKPFVVTKEKTQEQKNWFINCPDPEKFRNEYKNTNCPKQCNFQGFCRKGECRCFKGFLGDDCSQEDENLKTWLFNDPILI
jgi:hypothetical protein